MNNTVRNISILSLDENQLDGEALRLWAKDFPWNSVFAMAVSRYHAPFWQKQVSDPCLKFSCRLTSGSALTGDGTVFDKSKGNRKDSGRGKGSGGKGAPRGLPSPPTPEPTWQRRPRPDRTTPPPVDRNRSQEPCRLFALGKCPTPCKQGRLHACAYCGGSHPTKDHDKFAGETKKKDKGKGKKRKEGPA